jgi:hypothetical protein
LAESAEPFGLVIGVALLVLVFAAGVFVFHAYAPGEPVVGVVRSIGRTGARLAPAFSAVVDLPDGSATAVGLNWPTRCEAGRPIHWEKRRAPWGA